MNPNERDLRWSNAHNVRDLGNLPIKDGGLTQMGRLIRADTLSRLTSDGLDQLIDYGIRTVIDLRAPHEIEEKGSPFINLDWSGRYFNRPLEHFTPYVGSLIKMAQSQANLKQYKRYADPEDVSISFWMRPTATAEMMTQMLGHLHTTYGGIAEYLQFAGVNSTDIHDLKQLLTKSE